MRTGRLRHYVSLLRRATGQDALGQPSETFNAYAQTWAAIEPLKGDEFFSAERMVDRVDSRIVIRYVAGVLPFDRVSWNGRLFDIQSVVDVDSRNRELQLMAKEVM